MPISTESLTVPVQFVTEYKVAKIPVESLFHSQAVNGFCVRQKLAPLKVPLVMARPAPAQHEVISVIPLKLTSHFVGVEVQLEHGEPPQQHVVMLAVFSRSFPVVPLR